MLFLEGLEASSPPVLAVFSKNPFPKAPPKFIRVRRYKYTFSESGENTADWWHREFETTVLHKTKLQ